jgi:hypothetical protein
MQKTAKEKERKKLQRTACVEMHFIASVSTFTIPSTKNKERKIKARGEPLCLTALYWV